jgi:uncharacterized membrane protein
MAQEPNRVGGGVFIMLAIFIGVAIGAVAGNPALGVVGGILVGSAIAVAIWLRDRARIGE